MIEVYNLNQIELVLTDSYTIYYLVEGSMSAYIRGQFLTLSEDDLIVVNPYELGLIKPSLEGKSIIIKIVIEQEYINGNNEGIISFFNYIRREHLSISLKQSFLNLAYVYLLKEDTEDILDEVVQRIKLDSYFIKEKENWGSRRTLIKNLYEQGKLSSFLEEKVSDVAKLLNVSYTMVSVSFKEVTGSTISEYRQYDKIIKSALILAETDYSLEKIANMVGYESTKSLYDIYSNYVKSYPLEIRECIKNSKILSREDLVHIFKRINIYDINKSIENVLIIKHMTEIEEKLNLHGKKINDIVYDLRTVADDVKHLEKRLAEGYRFKYIQLNIYIYDNDIYLIDYREKIKIDKLIKLINQLALDGTELAIYIENANNEMKERIFKTYTENTLIIRQYIKDIIDNVGEELADRITWLLAYDIGLYKEGGWTQLEDKMNYLEKLYKNTYDIEATIKIQIRDSNRILGLMKTKEN